MVGDLVLAIGLGVALLGVMVWVLIDVNKKK